MWITAAGAKKPKRDPGRQFVQNFSEKFFSSARFCGVDPPEFTNCKIRRKNTRFPPFQPSCKHSTCSDKKFSTSKNPAFGQKVRFQALFRPFAEKVFHTSLWGRMKRGLFHRPQDVVTGIRAAAALRKRCTKVWRDFCKTNKKTENSSDFPTNVLYWYYLVV